MSTQLLATLKESSIVRITDSKRTVTRLMFASASPPQLDRYFPLAELARVSWGSMMMKTASNDQVSLCAVDL